MQALVYRQFGGPEVLRLEEAALPQPLARGSVLVAPRASTVNVIDYRSRNGELSPMVNKRFPKVPGVDVAGVVQAVGEGVTGFRVGDAVFGATDPFQGGAMAERVVVKAQHLALKPAALGFEQAATLPIAGVAALAALRDLGHVRAGQRVLVHGASGATGLFAVQIAKRLGAHVTTVSGPQGLQLLEQLGADERHDYRAEKPLRLQGGYDLILGFSNTWPFAEARRLLMPHGRFVEASPTPGRIVGSFLANPWRAQKNLMLMTAAKTADLAQLAQWVVDGELQVHIQGQHRLADARQAFAAMERGGAPGKQVVLIS